MTKRKTMTEKRYINWNELHQDTKILADKIKKSGVYTKIIAVSRGGLIPASIVSYELNIRNIQTVNVLSYDGEKQRPDTAFVAESHIRDADEQTLIIDDVSDTGKTFQLLHKMFPKAKLAAVYAKPSGVKYVDIYAVDMPDKWLVFPWDV